MALDWNPQDSRARGWPRNIWKRKVLDEIAKEGKTWNEVKKLATNRFRWKYFVNALCSSRGDTGDWLIDWLIDLRLGLPKGLLLSGFPTKTLDAFLNCSIRATRPAHLSRLDLRFLIMLGEEYNACSSLCNFLHSL